MARRRAQANTHAIGARAGSRQRMRSCRVSMSIICSFSKMRTKSASLSRAATAFDTVMVNAEDLALRNNRLWLLKDLHTDMNRVADLSKLAA